jgi:hypothetical protein
VRASLDERIPSARHVCLACLELSTLAISDISFQ